MVWAPLLALGVALSSSLPDDAVVAFVMVDRFADGSANLPDVVPGHPRRFQGGDLAGLRARLPYLEALGTTHVWITPVAQQAPGLVGSGDDATAAYHGYWPLDLEGVDPHFGTREELRALVDDAARRGMSVILDVVTNHLGYGAPDPLRLVRAECGTTETEACLFGLPDLETEDPRVRALVVERTAAWARDIPLAGFRFDAFKHVKPDVFRAIRGEVGRVRPQFFTIAEHWGAAPGDAAVQDIVASGAADAVFDFSLRGLARDWVAGRMRTAALVHHLEARDHALRDGPPMLTFLDNHDVETWAHATGARALLGAPLLLLDRATPVVTWGTELGRVGGAEDPFNRTMMPWDEAERAEHDVRAPLHAWRALIAQRRAHPVLHQGALRALALDAGAGPGRFVVLERRSNGARALVAMARDTTLRFVGPASTYARIAHQASSHGASAHLEVTSDGTTLVRLTVPANGFVSVILTETAGQPRAPTIP